MPSRWLLKTEPTTYSFADLTRERTTTWDGVRNALALQHLRAMTRGDEVLIYHSGADKAVVGVARVTRGPRRDPAGSDPRSVVVQLAPVRALDHPVPLATIKADPACADLALVRHSRLSVMPVSDRVWRRLLALGGG